MSRTTKERLALSGPDEEAGLLPFVYTDGGNGIRDADGATAFPSPLALAASFDEGLAGRYGAALGVEALAAGRNVLLGPVLDVSRVPWAGRTGEGLGEDAELTARIGGAIITGVQSQGVMVIAKHLVANNAELNRTGDGPVATRTASIDEKIDDRTLHEVYLKPFRRAIERHGLVGIMGSYNRMDGLYVCENPRLWQIVRAEWGFRGVTVPDFLFAVRDDEAALRAGMDLAALGGTAGRTSDMVGKLSDSALDELIRHLLFAPLAVGMPPAPPQSEAALGTPSSLDLAEEIATAGSVLLKNDGVLPLASALRVALFTPESLDHLTIIGGSAGVTLTPGRSAELGASLSELGHTVNQFTIAAADRPGARAGGTTWTSAVEARIQRDGESVESRNLSSFALGAEAVGAALWSAEVNATWTAPSDGGFRLTTTFAGRAEVLVNGQPRARGFREASPMIAGPEYPLHFVFDAAAGELVDVELHFETGPAITIPGTSVAPGFRLDIEPLDDPRALAEAAADADVAVVVVGRASGEGMDVESIALPEDQRRMLGAVAAAQPRTVVVSMGSGPVAIDWAEQVGAILHTWHAGERAGASIASLLDGKAEPTGRLPLTFPRTEVDVPLTEEGYPGVDGVAVYSEAQDVGYRGYPASGLGAAFPFGHGLGYTSFDIGATDWGSGAGALWVSGEVTNTGSRTGGTVVQLYVRRPGDSRAGLVGYSRLNAPAKESAPFRIVVEIEELRARVGDGWRLASGSYELHVGFSSSDLRHIGDLPVD